MGFDPTINLEMTFEGTKYEGAVVTVRLNPDLDTTMRLEELEESGQLVRLMLAFGEAVLIRWNIIDADGHPVPATGVGFLTQPTELCQLIIGAWRKVTDRDVDNDVADDYDIEELELGDLSVAPKVPVEV